MATYTPNYNLSKPEAGDQFGDFRQSYNDNMDIIDQNLGGGGGGGGGGHTIVDPNGTSMPSRSKLKFTGAVSVTDDSVNNATVVNVSGNELYLKNGLIGSDAGVYVTCNLDKTLVNGFYLVRVYDSSNGAVGWYHMKWEGNTQTLSIADTVGQGRLVITSTTAGLTYYSGAWRNIYCDILSLGGSGGGSGDTVSWTQIQATGEKIAEITINGTTTEVLIPFEAKIIVTTTTGLTVTATKGGTTYTATETSTGVYEVTVDSKGTWTVTDGTNATTVSVTAQTTYNVAFVVIPDGSTVTPTDDIQTWLHCANIWDKSYTTLAEVLADTTTLSALISDNNATDYLVRSTTWASGICADSTAMTYIGLNNYCANKLLADATWCDAICNSVYFESVLNVKIPTMTSDTTPSGVASASSVYGVDNPAWLGFDGIYDVIGDSWCCANGQTSNQYLAYEFTNSKKIYSVKLHGHPTSATWNPKNIKFQYYDNDSWVDVPNSATVFPSTTDTQTYVYSTPVESTKHRLFITDSYNSSMVHISSLQFYGREDV